jgi:hypothetical protein
MKRLHHILLASLLSFINGLLIVSLAVNPVIVSAQPYPAEVDPYGQPELEQLLAPIALYPDELLGHVLAAAAYTNDVVAADQFVHTRFSSNYAKTQAVLSEPWDDSVKYLVQFPNVLDMMNSNLDWTQRLGDAFYSQQGDVMSTIQELRQRALDARTLTSNRQILVESDNGVIIIKTRRSNRIYVPYYNPTVIYGTWDQPDYPPVVFAPPYEYRQNYYAPVIAFSVAVIIVDSLFFPIYPDWHRHYLRRGDWRGHNNWQSNTQWRFNQQRREAAVTFNATQNRLQTQRAPMLNNNINRNGQRAPTNNQTPLPGIRAPLVQPNRAQALQPNRAPAPQPNRLPGGLRPNQAQVPQPNQAPALQPNRLPGGLQPNRAQVPQPNQAPALQPNRLPGGLQPNRLPSQQTNRAPTTIQPNAGFSRGGQIHPPENRAPLAPQRERPNARFSREAAPVRPPANIVQEQRRAPVAQPRAQPNAGIPHGGPPAQPARPAKKEIPNALRPPSER